MRDKKHHIIKNIPAREQGFLFMSKIRVFLSLGMPVFLFRHILRLIYSVILPSKPGSELRVSTRCVRAPQGVPVLTAQNRYIKNWAFNGKAHSVTLSGRISPRLKD